MASADSRALNCWSALSASTRWSSRRAAWTRPPRCRPRDLVGHAVEGGGRGGADAGEHVVHLGRGLGRARACDDLVLLRLGLRRGSRPRRCRHGIVERRAPNHASPPPAPRRRPASCCLRRVGASRATVLAAPTWRRAAPRRGAPAPRPRSRRRPRRRRRARRMPAAPRRREERACRLGRPGTFSGSSALLSRSFTFDFTSRENRSNSAGTAGCGSCATETARRGPRAAARP